MDELTIRPSDLRNGLEIDKVIESYSLKGVESDVLSQKLRISYHAVLLAEEVLVTGDVKGEIELSCYSCNEKFVSPIEFQIVQSYPSNVELIDMEDEIRQLLILNLPIRPLCRADCLGLCPKCGKNLNAGKCSCTAQLSSDRWEKLKDLLKK
jgi:uncharacterized protein